MAFAIHIILPQVKELPNAIQQVQQGSFWWLLAAFGVSLIGYIAGAISLQGSLEQSIPLWPATEVTLATAFTGLLAPQGVGALTTNLHFLDKQGVPATIGATAVGLNAVAGVLVHMVSLVFAVAVYGRSLLGDVRVPPRWELLVAAAVVAIVVGAIVWSPFGQRKVIPQVLKSARALGATLRNPVRAGQLFGGSALITFANALALTFAMDAFGRTIPTGKVIAVYLVGATIASIAPTPGGLGALEAALVAGLTAVGSPAGTAVGGVLVFRLLTFWLPIAPGAWTLRRLRSRGLV
jgi:undecaprenyl-diphosphatase